MVTSAKSKKSILSSIINIISKIILIILIFILGVNIYVAVLEACFNQQFIEVFGYTDAIVISGSMEPQIDVGDMVIIHEKDSYQIGDIITFIQGDETGVTHRIIGQTDNGFITKGDANNTEDMAVVTSDQIVGKVVKIIPHLGTIFNAMSSTLGIIISIFVCFAFIEISYLISKFRKKQKK